MERLPFILPAIKTLAFALAAREANSASSEQQPSQASPTGVEQRIINVLQAYDVQGNHRTGTAVHGASPQWLASEGRQSGF
jgi:hypothetical protein